MQSKKEQINGSNVTAVEADVKRVKTYKQMKKVLSLSLNVSELNLSKDKH